MKTSSINLTIQLDDQNVPEKIIWDGTDKPEGTPSETKAIALAIWDPTDQNTLRIDLWTKDMPVDHMKRFYIESINGLAQSVLRATGDEKMAAEMNTLCDSLVKYVNK